MLKITKEFYTYLYINIYGDVGLPSLSFLATKLSEAFLWLKTPTTGELHRQYNIMY
jgi:hypothetical protein